MTEQDQAPQPAQPDDAQVRCGVCSTVFVGRRALAAHRPTDPAATYPDPPKPRPDHARGWPEGMHECIRPEALKMIHGPGGAWILPPPAE